MYKSLKNRLESKLEFALYFSLMSQDLLHTCTSMFNEDIILIHATHLHEAAALEPRISFDTLAPQSSYYFPHILTDRS